MSTIEELIRSRKEKLQALEKKGINPFPPRIEIPGQRIGISKARESLDKEVLVCGRLWSIRSHGAMVFADLKDESGKIQILFSKNVLDEKFSAKGGPTSGWEIAGLLDSGDFLAAKGKVFQTKAGEITVEVSEFQILAKSLRPLPSEWYGLKDEEEKLRKRYLDILLNPELKDLFSRKAKFWQSTRNFLVEKGFIEVETPVLETTTGGADARPFETHHNALDIDVYLRISMGELWQKRLMVAGFEKTFEIGRQFRNEGMDAEHLQDYSQMEFYWSYASYLEGMALVEEMFKRVAQETFGTQKFTIGKFEIDLSKSWERYDYTETIKKMTGVYLNSATLEEIEKRLRELKVDYSRKGFNYTRAVDNLWKYCRRQLSGPGFLIHVPVSISPLAKRKPDQPDLTERFQVIIAGSELGNGYSELNDPIDQAGRFEDQQKLREAGDEEAQMDDRDFVEALEYGMPPTCGFGLSERLFAFLENKTMRECQIFPLVKPKD